MQPIQPDHGSKMTLRPGPILSAFAALFLLLDGLGKVMKPAAIGGAVASNLRVGSPLLSHVLFPVYIGLLVWGGLYLRGERLRSLFPLRRRP